MRHANVRPVSRMHQAVNQFSVHYGAAANSRAHGEVNEIRDPSRRAPTHLRQSRRVHVRIEAHRHIQRAPQRPRQIVVLPFQFWGGCDVSESGRIRMEIYRTK